MHQGQRATGARRPLPHARHARSCGRGADAAPRAAPAGRLPAAGPPAPGHAFDDGSKTPADHLRRVFYRMVRRRARGASLARPHTYMHLLRSWICVRPAAWPVHVYATRFLGVPAPREGAFGPHSARLVAGHNMLARPQAAQPQLTAASTSPTARQGLDDKDIVALSGAHTLGRARPERSGWGKEVTKYTKDGPGKPGGQSWTVDWLTFNNTYFKVGALAIL